MNLRPYLVLMAERGASDLFFTTGAPVSMKIDGVTKAVGKVPLELGMVKNIAYSIMSEEKVKEFEASLEMNLGLTVDDVGRFRVNVYKQRGEVSMVIRYIKAQIPSFATLGLPSALKQLVLQKKGLILVVGSTGSGKSTTLASMLDYRNEQQSGHILTIEDPIEYMFQHKQSIIGQREVGLDTLSYENALREAMREAPDVIMIGEIRDRTTMEAALSYADTGHLCLATLHAVNANQALERVINFFPNDAHNQLLMDLSLNLNAVISQRLVPAIKGNRTPAVEVLLNSPYIAELIRRGNIREIKETMEKSGDDRMQTFDQALYELYKKGRIDIKTALANADSYSNLEWKINFGGGVKGATNHQRPKGALEFPKNLDDLPEVHK